MKDLVSSWRRREGYLGQGFPAEGKKWAKFGDMLILDSPLVCWTGLINVAPRHRELAEAGQERSSSFLRRPSTEFMVVQRPRHEHQHERWYLVGSAAEKRCRGEVARIVLTVHLVEKQEMFS